MYKISGKYIPNLIEDEISKKWIDGDYFSSYPDNNKDPYTIIMPPPNVTGSLHIGHMLNNTIQDVLARYFRMNNYNVCWVPGLDHASIATEAKVVEELQKNKKSKFLLGRKKYISYVKNWSKHYRNIIIGQLKKLGCSCDWKREKFTMDEDLYKSVIKIFIDLYEKGYIYKKYHIVNWDVKAKTTISDEEVYYLEKVECIYYIKYFVKNENFFITVVTTRPETIFGDTAICVNPYDSRYTSLIGKKVIIPIVNREIPIIKDIYVNKNFGTGCLKITPAHDINDKKIADKYDLDIINIFNKNGTLNKNGFHYKGMDRFVARKKIVNELKKLGFLEKVENIKHNIGYSERTSSVIEYIPSIQWFLKTKKMASAAIEIVKKKKIIFFPEKIKNVFFHWMNNICDWNISRQLWWGHRIPAYYYGKNINDFVIAENLEEALKKAKKKINNYKLTYNDLWQDEDVLDTWFSSWIFPISVFNGIIDPNNVDINYYYPSDDIVTGSDILFFWIARMIMFGLFFKKEIPFKRVFFTGIIRDSYNKKMSKSLGNSPDFTLLIDKYGADSMRIGIMLNASAGKDFNFKESICFQGKNFINKVWNAFRLIKGWKNNGLNRNIDNLNNSLLLIKWIENRFYYILEIFEKEISSYKLDKSLMILYKFIWNDFCSRFLEIIKPAGKELINEEIYKKIVSIFLKILILLHPYAPFISEKIWNILKNDGEKKIPLSSIILSKWPKKNFYDKNILCSFKILFEIISKIRNIRNEYNISKKSNFFLFSENLSIKKFNFILKKLENIELCQEKEKKKNSVYFSFSINFQKFFLFIDKIIFLEKNEKKILKSISNIKRKIEIYDKFLLNIRKKLSNKKFLLSVSEKMIIKERKKERDTSKIINSMKINLKNLNKLITFFKK